MTELAKRYGGSLYELAAEENLTDELLQQLRTAVNSIEAEPQYLRLLSTPSVPKKERCALLDKAFEEPTLPRQLPQAAVRGGSAGGAAGLSARVSGPLQC